MTPSDYVEQVLRTRSGDYPKIADRLLGSKGLGEIDHNSIDLLHAGMGLCTEAGEFMDALKKSIYYGRATDKVNLTEELGDVLWYVALACNALGVHLEDVMCMNIGKLRARYPDKFTEDKATDRDLLLERKTLDAGLKPFKVGEMPNVG